MAYKGFFKPYNRNKYLGNIAKIKFRSLWERRFMIHCDNSNSIIEWSSEELKIKYISPLDNRWHTYYPDFYIKILDKYKTMRELVIEIKPKKQCSPPKERKNKKTFLYESKNFIINTSKWKAAREFCKIRGWEFKILTEDHIQP